ncbi:MAG TPA: serine hydrolase domain-containing protein, partial [Longimicrobiales bacterium]|nr:serine hydrolase domain-containing protein [Longimicrobiales bacterium]
ERALAELQARLARDAAEDGVGALVAAVALGDSVVWGQAYGWADPERGVPADTAGLYRVGSISKTVTAALLARLVDRGTVSLDDPVERWLPEVRQLGEPVAGSAPITLRQLASHTAGLIREPRLDDAASGPIAQWEAKVLASIPATAFRAAPGTEYHYSNIGYGILGLALQRAAGRPFMELVEEEVFRPLGMRHSTFVVDGGLRPRLAVGQANGRRGEVDTKTPAREHAGRGYKVPNGGVYATAGDLARFMAGLTGAGTRAFLRPDTRAAMLRAQTPGDTAAGYGLGLSIAERGGWRMVSHGGSVAGYTAYVVAEAATGLSVVLLRSYDRGATPLSAVATDALEGLVAAAAPHPELAAATDAVFAEWDQPGSPGCAVGVFQDGRVAYARGYGWADLDHALPITPRTVFYMASVSKQFTAAAVTLAALEGKLSLDDDVRRWFPELPDYRETITVRHLLHHTSGLRDYLTLMSLADMPLENPWAVDEVLALVARQQGLNFAPGSAYSYSNSGYLLLSELVRRATGQSLREYTDARFFRPLGMTSTHFHDDRGMVVPGRAFSYGRTPSGDDDDDGERGGRYRLSYLANFDQVGSGGLMSTVMDLFAWDREFYWRSLGEGRLVPTTLTRGVLTTGDTITYAHGITHGEYRGLPTVGHGGSMMGFKTYLLRFPDERFAVTALCNLGSINPGPLTERVADAWLADRLAPAPERAGAAEEGAGAEASEADPPLPAGVAGRYASEELGVTWEIAEGEDGLVLRRAGAGERELRVSGPDRLRAGSWTLEIERDGAGRVIGFTVDAGRARGMRFQRVG